MIDRTLPSLQPHPTPQTKNGDNLCNDFIYKQEPSEVVETNSIPFVQWKEGT